MTAQFDTPTSPVAEQKIAKQYEMSSDDIIDPKVYFVSRATAMKVVDRLNDKFVFVEDIKPHLEKASLKRLTGLKSLTGVSAVYVDDNGSNHDLLPHRFLPYNQEFRRFWDDPFIYGNLMIVLSDKAYNSIPAERRTTNADAVVF